MATKTKPAAGDNLMEQLQLDKLLGEAQNFGRALGQRGIERLEEMANSSGKAVPKMAADIAKGDSPLKAGAKVAGSKVKDAVTDAVPGLGGGKGKGAKGNKVKVTTIIEHVDVPVSREIAYQQWTQFQEFPKFMKKVENVSQEADEKLKFQAQIVWSHRTWEATITDQVPNERIVWRSQGQKGHVDGAVTFHELAPELTRVLAVLEYHPKGLFEKTGNIWRAQGRRARVELKHFQRHVSTQTLIHQDDVDGWEGEIHDSQVVPEEKQGSGSRQNGRQGAKKSGPAKKTAAAKKAPAKKSTSSTRGGSAAKKSSPAKKTAAAKKAPAKKAPAKKSTSSQSRRSTAKKASSSRR